MNVIFMGTPEFAVPALRALLGSNHKIIAAYTQPPRPAGRGYHETPSAIHMLAVEHHIPVYTPISLKDSAEQEIFKNFKADIAVVAAYGLLLPKVILEGTKYGCINIHPSLLPRWRGASPIQRTLMAGDEKTSVCIMQMDEGLDTGDILLEEHFSIPPEMNAGEMHDVLAGIGAKLTLEVLKQFENGTTKRLKQSTEGVTYAKKLSKQDGLINFNQPCRLVHAQIRGVTPWPGAYFNYNGESIRIMKASFTEKSLSATPGTILSDTLDIACLEGIISPLVLQRPGKKPLLREEFLRGFSIPIGTTVG